MSTSLIAQIMHIFKTCCIHTYASPERSDPLELGFATRHPKKKKKNNASEVSTINRDMWIEEIIPVLVSFGAPSASLWWTR